MKSGWLMLAASSLMAALVCFWLVWQQSGGDTTSAERWIPPLRVAGENRCTNSAAGHSIVYSAHAVNQVTTGIDNAEFMQQFGDTSITQGRHAGQRSINLLALLPDDADVLQVIPCVGTGIAYSREQLVSGAGMHLVLNQRGLFKLMDYSNSAHGSLVYRGVHAVHY